MIRLRHHLMVLVAALIIVAALLAPLGMEVR